MFLNFSFRKFETVSPILKMILSFQFLAIFIFTEIRVLRRNWGNFIFYEIAVITVCYYYVLEISKYVFLKFSYHKNIHFTTCLYENYIFFKLNIYFSDFSKIKNLQKNKKKIVKNMQQILTIFH